MQHTIDTSGLARTAGELRGEYPLGSMARLGTMLVDREGELVWRLRGWRERAGAGPGHDFMALSIAATVRVACVRCTGPVAVGISIERAYRLVRSEAEAERLDLDDSRYDVLAGGRRFDLAALIEDETIMAVPVMPRHERCELPVCAAQPRVGEAAPDARVRPFARLEWLRNGTQKTDMIED